MRKASTRMSKDACEARQGDLGSSMHGFVGKKSKIMKMKNYRKSKLPEM